MAVGQVRALIEIMKRVADLDGRIKEREDAIGEIEAERKAIEASLLRKEEALKELSEQSKEADKREYHIEHQMHTKEAKLGDLEAKLFAARTNEEFRALKEEAERWRREIGRMEDEALECLTEAEEIRRRIESAEEELKAAERQAADKVQTLEERKEELKRDLAHYKEQRNRAAEQLPHHILEKYERIRAKVRGCPLAEADRENLVCKGCFISVTLQQVNEILQGEQLVFCRSCNRILYIDEQREAE